MTGAVVSSTDDTIVVREGKDQWEIGRDSSTKSMANRSRARR
jgi:hypothetical protein